MPNEKTSETPINEPLPVASHSNERLTMFSDGVFAITITLLVLEIKVPDIPEPLVAAELTKELLHLVPKFIGHILSFIILGLYWIAHHNMFIHIKRHDHVLLWLNTLFLLCIASIPFPTGLLGHYPNQQISVIAYAGILFLTGVFLNIIWWYATTHRLVDANLGAPFIAFVHRYIRIAPAFYLGSVVASFLSLSLAKVIFIAVAIVYIIPNPFHRKHYNQLARRFDQ